MDEIKTTLTHVVPQNRVRQFFGLLHGRGMDLKKLGRLIGNASHCRVSEAIRCIPGRGRDVRRKLIRMRALTDEEMEVLGWIAPEQHFDCVGDMGEIRKFNQ